jgi:hypothetical protein
MKSKELQSRKGINFKFPVLFSVIVLICIAFSYVYAGPLQDNARKQNDSSVDLMTALKNGLVNVTIEGSETGVKLTVNKNNKNEELNIVIPKGLTKLGFVENGSIKIGGRGSSTIFGQEYKDMKLYVFVDTNKLDGDGFSLELNKELYLKIPKGESEKSSLVKGSLNVNVPSGYMGFDLAGMSGKVVEGEIGIEKNTFNKEKDKNYREFRIKYGNMKVKNR